MERGKEKKGKRERKEDHGEKKTMEKPLLLCRGAESKESGESTKKENKRGSHDTKKGKKRTWLTKILSAKILSLNFASFGGCFERGGHTLCFLF